MILDSISCKAFLSDELAKRIQVNRSYSQRAFARHLGLSPGELSEVLRGKRCLSLKSALKISRVLGLNPAEAKHLIYLAQVERGSTNAREDASVVFGERELKASQLSIDIFQIVSEWYCFAILNLAECEFFSFKPSWIAKKLGISVNEVTLALERLERVGLLNRKNGQLQVSADFILSPSGIPSEAIRNYHRQFLQKAIEAIDSQPVEDRELSGTQLAIDPKNIQAIKQEIAEFRDRISKKYTRGRKSEVFHLEIAFFRITQKNSTENSHV